MKFTTCSLKTCLKLGIVKISIHKVHHIIAACLSVNKISILLRLLKFLGSPAERKTRLVARIKPRTLNLLARGEVKSAYVTYELLDSNLWKHSQFVSYFDEAQGCWGCWWAHRFIFLVVIERILFGHIGALRRDQGWYLSVFQAVMWHYFDLSMNEQQISSGCMKVLSIGPSYFNDVFVVYHRLWVLRWLQVVSARVVAACKRWRGCFRLILVGNRGSINRVVLVCQHARGARLIRPIRWYVRRHRSLTCNCIYVGH